MRNFLFLQTAKKAFLFFVLVASLVLCSCESEAPYESSSIASNEQQSNSESMNKELSSSSEDLSSCTSFVSESTESNVLDAYLDSVKAVLDASRPKEAYEFPDLSGEITDIRITVRERDVDLTFRNLEGHKAYDIFYGYYSDGEWHDYPSANYDLKSLVDKDIWGSFVDAGFGYDVAVQTHIVEIGPYYLIAHPVSMPLNTMTLLDLTVQDTAHSETVLISELFVPANNGSDHTLNLHFTENMRCYGTSEYVFRLRDFSPWCFVILEKAQLTEDYLLTVNVEWDLVRNSYDSTFSYDEISNALGQT